MFKRTFARTNSGQFEGTAHENVGFRGKKGQKFHPNFAPNIAMEFHYHAFCATESQKLVLIFNEFWTRSQNLVWDPSCP